MNDLPAAAARVSNRRADGQQDHRNVLQPHSRSPDATAARSHWQFHIVALCDELMKAAFARGASNATAIGLLARAPETDAL
ncbi:MAG: hypothetical protein CMJ58_22875 [Planctomycetaceae bacterium]|nr:hypothetical protein [Planctomycetaceae bacterium]